MLSWVDGAARPSRFVYGASIKGWLRSTDLEPISSKDLAEPMRPKLVLCVGFVLLSQSALAGGAACVMAKYQGQTLDYALAHGRPHPAGAQEAARQELRAKGYADYLSNLDVMRAQNLSKDDHAYVIVIRSEFKDWRGKDRSAMGCGFNAQSYRGAELDAVRDLQAYFWGWKPDQHGYKVLRKFQY